MIKKTKQDAIAPKAGYATASKQAYREAVWSALLPVWEETKHDDRAHILLMPSREGLEIDHVISLGVPENRIIAIDQSAAVIATSTWRKKYPSVKFFAATVADCPTKVNKTGAVIAAANLDFCSNFSDDLIGQFETFCRNVNFYDSARIAVTVAKGREGKALVRMVKTSTDGSLGPHKEPRIAALMSCAGFTQEHIIWSQGSYVSGRVPMAWSVMSLNNYILKRLVCDHIAELKAVNEIHEAAQIVEDYGIGCIKSASKKWLMRKADEFQDQIDSKLKGVRLAGESVNIGGAYSTLAFAANDAMRRIDKVLQAAYDAYLVNERKRYSAWR